MPFISNEQRRACWIKYHQELLAGLKPKWDCYEFQNKSKNKRVKK